jgi:hypothetical protein
MPKSQIFLVLFFYLPFIYLKKILSCSLEKVKKKNNRPNTEPQGPGLTEKVNALFVFVPFTSIFSKQQFPIKVKKICTFPEKTEINL